MHRWMMTCVLVLSLLPSAEAQLQQVDRNAPSARGLIGLWRGVSGFTWGTKFYDLTGFGNHGTLTNMGTAGTTSGWGVSTLPSSFRIPMDMRFDGTDDRIELVATPQLIPPAMSVFAWVKSNAWKDYGSIVTWRDSTGSSYGRAFYTRSTGAMAVYLVASGGAPTKDPTTATMSTNRWYHVGWTYDAVTGLIVYQDCQSVGTAAAAGTLTQSSLPWGFGWEPVAATNYFTGTIAEVRMYDRALPQEEICRIRRESQQGDQRLLPSKALLALMAPDILAKSGLLPFFPSTQ